MSLFARVLSTTAFVLYSALFITAGPIATAEIAEKVVYDKWTPFYDLDENLVFIDFEALDFNLLEIKVYDSKANLVFSDRVDDLPFNSIYELDVAGFNGSDYRIHLHSHTSIYPAELKLLR